MSDKEQNFPDFDDQKPDTLRNIDWNDPKVRDKTINLANDIFESMSELIDNFGAQADSESIEGNPKAGYFFARVCSLSIARAAISMGLDDDSVLPEIFFVENNDYDKIGFYYPRLDKVGLNSNLVTTFIQNISEVNRIRSQPQDIMETFSDTLRNNENLAALAMKDATEGLTAELVHCLQKRLYPDEMEQSIEANRLLDQENIVEIYDRDAMEQQSDLHTAFLLDEVSSYIDYLSDDENLNKETYSKVIQSYEELCTSRALVIRTVYWSRNRTNLEEGDTDG